MATEPRLPYENRLEDFQAIVRAAQVDIANRVRQAIQTGDLSTAARQRAQLASVIAVLDQMGAAIEPLARQIVAQAHQESADLTAQRIRGLHITAPEIPGSFTGVSREAVKALQAAITGRLQESRRIVGRTVQDVYARAGRRAALRAVLGAAGSPREAQRQMTMDLMRDRDVARMVREGGFGFVDRAGKRWALDTYTEMAIRTVTRQAVVEGALARMASHGITLGRITSVADPCPICEPYDGRLVSLTGEQGDYRGEAVYSLGELPNGGPPLHPNCRHSIGPVAVSVDELRAELAATGVQV